MRLLLIATSDDTPQRCELLNRMLASVAVAADERHDIEVKLLLLLQNSTEAQASDFRHLPSFVLAERIACQVSLSRARNTLLRKACELDLVGSDTIVLFPDDDCWYPSGLLAYVHDLFAREKELDFWFCRYDSDPLKPQGQRERLAKARDVIRHACSITMMLRGAVVSAIGRFDENIGIGTPLAGGEDTNFALSAFRISRQTVFADAAFMGHPRDEERRLRVRGRYFGGTLLAIARHARAVPGVPREFARKLLVGAWLIMRRELNLYVYVGLVSRAIKTWRLEPFREFPQRSDTKR